MPGWAKQPEAWTASRQNLEMPVAAMRRYVTWLKALPGKPVFVGYPIERGKAEGAFAGKTNQVPINE